MKRLIQLIALILLLPHAAAGAGETSPKHLRSATSVKRFGQFLQPSQCWRTWSVPSGKDRFRF